LKISNEKINLDKNEDRLKQNELNKNNSIGKINILE
jgi:hypothetical protein